MARARYPIRPRAPWLDAARFMTLAALLLGTVAAAGSRAWVVQRGAAGPGWSLEHTPNALVANGELAADACPGPARCVAVGSYETSSGTSALAESWNGAAWSVERVPVPAGGTHSALDGVSCSAATACAAVGDYTDSAGTLLTLAERWNGTSWSVQSAPSPANASRALLTGVSCGSATSCVAVGTYHFSGHNEARLVESWNGTTWALQQAKSPAGSGGSALSGVSCAAAAACVAVGSYAARRSGEWVTLAEVWDGSTWRDTPSPNAAGSVVGRLFGVSCSSATACTAVGDSIQQSGSPLGVTLAEAWNGSTWAIQPTPNPAGTAGVDELNGVSCRSATSCTAVGSAVTVTGDGAKTLGESWNGTAWTIAATPDPGPAYSSLAGVSCAAAGSCTAVGSRNSSGTHLTLGLVSDGTSWKTEATPSPAGAVPSALLSVSCAAPTACTAVGYFSNGPDRSQTLAERWNGTTWTVQHTPDPAGFGQSSLRSVSCTSASACVAVGYASAGRSGTTVAESWNGKTWALQPAAATPGTFGDLYGVSCTSATACTAVGYDRNAGNVAIPLAESWNGKTWTVERAASPAGGFSIAFQSVSCTSASACTAVGSYKTLSSTDALAERWNGATWTIQATPPGDHENYLTGVSCATLATCIAVGTTYTFEHFGTLAERWRDGVWRLVKTPAIVSDVATLNGVACRSAAVCAAVGGYSLFGTEVPLAEAWNGTTWAIQPTPAPRGGSGSVLAGVSPTSGTSFTAVGSAFNSARVSVTLAETGPG